MGFDLRLDGLELVHQFFVDVEAAGGIQNHNVVAVVFGVGNRLLGDLHWVSSTHLKHRDADLLPHHLELFDSRRAVDVAGDQQRPLALVFKVEGQLAGMGGLACALKATHHDDGGDFRGHVNPGVNRTHQSGHLIVDNLYDLLGGGQALQYLVSNGLFGDRGDEILGHFVVDVGFQEGEAHLPHGLLHVGFFQFSLGAQPFKRFAQLIGKAFKCHGRSTSFLFA